MHIRLIHASLRLALVASVVVALIAIGGPRHVRTAVAAGDCVANETIDDEEQAFLRLINQHRAQNGRAPLGLSHSLSRAAAWKSQDLGVQRYFAHDDLDRSWVQRIRDCGYRYNTYLGENIAAGISSAQAAFDLWKNSSGHNANMLGANYTTIGIGREYVAGSPYGWYWTTEFGGFDDGYAEIADPEPIEPLPQPGVDDAPAADTTAPEVTVRSRGHGRTVNVTARASDGAGVVRVEFWADGRLIATDDRAPYRTRVRATRTPMTIEARAYDAAGNAGIDTMILRARRR